jgi:bifunctional DNase/RNase
VSDDFQNLFPDEGLPDAGQPEARVPRLREVKVSGIYERRESEGEDDGDVFVMLEDRHNRKVPIFIGRPEAMAIGVALEQQNFLVRPLTHDLMRTILEKLGAEVEQLAIDDLFQDTFYAKLTIRAGGESIEVDCRPSDGMALALRFKAPIYMDESVIESVNGRE